MIFSLIEIVLRKNIDEPISIDLLGLINAGFGYLLSPVRIICGMVPSGMCLSSC